jgi:crotonobetainyl-CoA:carnitine CoA-transferase CaiB-like acyl-CoA transferase
MHAIGRDDLGNDPELAHNDGRARRSAELDAAIEAWTLQRPVDEVIATLDAAGVPVGKAYTAADIAHDPQYLTREMVLEVRDSHGLPLKVPGIAPKLSATPGAIQHPAPRLGEHTRQAQDSPNWPTRH